MDGKEVEHLYDPSAPLVVEEIGKLAGQFGAARIVIEGHTDSSMKGRVPEEDVQMLSGNRANAVEGSDPQEVPVKLQPNQSTSPPAHWSRPADPGDPMNQAKNRRVEVKVYPLETPK